MEGKIVLAQCFFVEKLWDATGMFFVIAVNLLLFRLLRDLFGQLKLFSSFHLSLLVFH